MKRVLFVFVLFSSFTSCFKFRNTGTEGVYSEYDDTSLAKVIVKGTLVVGIMDYAPPCAYMDSNGKAVGFDVDVFNEIAKRLDIEVEFKVVNWANKENMLGRGEIDCIASAFTFSNSRQLGYALTVPTLYNAQVVVVRNSSKIFGLNDLDNKKIAYLHSTDIFRLSERNINFNADFKQFVSYPSFLVALDDLRLHAVDAVIMDLLIINSTMEKSVSDYRVLGEALTSEKYVYAFRKNDKVLRDAVNKIMLELEYEGKILEFSKKWFGGDIYLFGR